ncbi:hypothetical protein QBC37DRAFT_323642 [Rhypophila decipiens]|uniref:Uncharacterized protein n=1 Tax=Rhypophila decipiens TaxID=261697 RepID=A0AAN7B452_9PEZI|nr:hypothetical protein QBC37DRAFT_323642 [Rhypophila decipiens]
MAKAKPLHLLGLPVFLVVLNPSFVAGSETKTKWTVCRDRFHSVLAGNTVNTTVGSINNVTIKDMGFLYEGPIHGLAPHLDANDILTITYEGCVAICSSEVELQEPRDALSMVATWIFPLAIALSLPYEAFHRRKFIRTLGATVNWLGSPQTALTATIFNFRQIRQARRLSGGRTRPGDSNLNWNDAFYVLTCMSQYDIVGITLQHLETLMYGLFRPAVHEAGSDDDESALLTHQLLSQLAFQLRMLRRRAVIPTLASLGTFLVAYVFSVVLSFAELTDSASVDQLALGLLWSWLPVLVMFTIVDRNPVSGNRAKVLMERWLHNVQAVKLHREGKTPVIHTTAIPLAPLGPAAHAPITTLRVGPGGFIGQGRSIQYAGLSHAVMAEEPSDDNVVPTFPKYYTDLADRVYQRLRPNRPRPFSWFMTALVSQVAVISVIMLAFMLAFNTPTVGLGCWSGSFALYAVLSSISWFLSLFTSHRPGQVVTGLCYFFNGLAFCWLITVTFLILTGAMNTCYCQTSPFAYPRFGGYMTFEPPSKMREMFNVTKYWATAAGFGLAIPFVAFSVAVIWWLRCVHLWKVSEDGTDLEMARFARGLKIDMRWLAS